MTTSLESRSDFVRLIAKVQAGDETAARKLYERYGPVIVSAVRRRLDARLRSKFDSIDFAQDVWASFFTNVIDKYELSTPQQLVGLLTTMARNKVLQTQRRRTQRQKYNIEREASLQGRAELVPAAQQTPSQIVMDKEAWDRLLARQPPVYRRILLLLREGFPHEKIADDLGLSLKTVQRVIRKLTT
ncbi:MAG: sigma-70 family RNA polymerase sigma factor [Gemmataceae bacterium]|nr:sigma-70 family RNA polymerase sigma factor [Gemmataceae bacterium]